MGCFTLSLLASCLCKDRRIEVRARERTLMLDVWPKLDRSPAFPAVVRHGTHSIRTDDRSRPTSLRGLCKANVHDDDKSEVRTKPCPPDKAAFYESVWRQGDSVLSSDTPAGHFQNFDAIETSIFFLGERFCLACYVLNPWPILEEVTFQKLCVCVCNCKCKYWCLYRNKFLKVSVCWWVGA